MGILSAIFQGILFAIGLFAVSGLIASWMVYIQYEIKNQFIAAAVAFAPIFCIVVAAASYSSYVSGG